PPPAWCRDRPGSSGAPFRRRASSYALSELVERHELLLVFDLGGAKLFVGPANRAKIAIFAGARRGGRGQEAFREGVAHGLGDEVGRGARLVVQQDGDVLEFAVRGAVVEAPGFDALAREDLLESERVKHRLQDLSATDDHAVGRARLAGLVV